MPHALDPRLNLRIDLGLLKWFGRRKRSFDMTARD
jgi:hypothetical protein